MSYQRDFQKRLKIGVIGVGSHCYRNLLPVMNFLPVQLLAVCDVNAQQVQRTALQYGCRGYTSAAEMYEKEPEIEAVFIAVGPKLHPELVCEALDAGRHVWVEKPIAVRAAQVDEMIAHRGNRIVVVGLKKAFMPAAFKAREIARSPRYGGLRSMLAVYHMDLPQNGEQVLAEGDTPNWLRNGVHPLSFMMSVGGPVKEVTAVTNPAGQGAVLLRFENEVMGTLHLSCGPQPDVESYALYADRWELTIRDTQVALRRSYPFVYRETTTYAPEGDDSGTVVWEAPNCVSTLENKAEFTQGFYNEMRYFCDCVLEGRQPELGTLEFSRQVMQVYEAALLSHGHPVAIG